MFYWGSEAGLQMRGFNHGLLSFRVLRVHPVSFETNAVGISSDVGAIWGLYGDAGMEGLGIRVRLRDSRMHGEPYGTTHYCKHERCNGDSCCIRVSIGSRHDQRLGSICHHCVRIAKPRR